MSSSSATELEVIINQPSARSSSILQRGSNPLDLAPDLLKETKNPQNDETGSQDPLIFADRQPKVQLLNLSDEDTILINGALNTSNGSMKQRNEARETSNKDLLNKADVQNEATNSTKEVVKPSSKKSESNKNNRDYSLNGPDLNPGTENLGLSLCLMQFCNLCSACVVDCCDQYYNWCCCCCIDSDICVNCCTGCMECCAGCECADWCN